ncbi:MAG TPA: hypothetical protein PLY96_16955 [Chromatiaceae bacterium]|nr:hypothetical protein [Chromatiaceae bacterium]
MDDADIFCCECYSIIPYGEDKYFYDARKLLNCFYEHDQSKTIKNAIERFDEAIGYTGSELEPYAALSGAVLSAIALGIDLARENPVTAAKLLSAIQRERVEKRHSAPGGSRDKANQIRAIWATGKYSSRDICAEQECAALGMSFKTARNALIGTPKPK